MEYQLRIGIRTNLISDCDIEFVYKGITFQFLLKDKDKPQKLYVVVDAKNWQEALNYFFRNSAQLFDKLILCTGERFEAIWWPEIILLNEVEKVRRTLWYHDIDILAGHLFNASQMDILKKLLETEIDKRDMDVVSYLRLSIESYNMFDKYLNTFKAAECVCDQKKEIMKPSKPKSEHFHEVFNIPPYDNSMFSIDWKRVIDLRNKCAHVSNREKIDIDEIRNKTWEVFCRVRNYLENKYFSANGIRFMEISPGPLPNSGVTSGYHEYPFITKHPNEKFALDAPTLDEIRSTLGER